MEEFAKMIYENWRNSEEEDGGYINWGKFGEAVAELDKYLSEKLSKELEDALIREAWNIEKNAFITGFGYACKCLSNGKIEFNK